MAALHDLGLDVETRSGELSGEGRALGLKLGRGDGVVGAVEQDQPPGDRIAEQGAGMEEAGEAGVRRAAVEGLVGAGVPDEGAGVDGSVGGALHLRDGTACGLPAVPGVVGAVAGEAEPEPVGAARGLAEDDERRVVGRKRGREGAEAPG